MKKYLTVPLLMFIALVLYFTVSEISGQDILAGPGQIFPDSSFMKNRFLETKMNNILEAIMINYRSTDTIGGIIILLTSVITVSALLRSGFTDHVKVDLNFDNIIL